MTTSTNFSKKDTSSDPFEPLGTELVSHLCICLCVLRVRAYLTTNQQHGIPCLIERGPLPDLSPLAMFLPRCVKLGVISARLGNQD
jgi:hypothetical protein